ncbi:transposase [Plastoroseomonas arctica]|uniref:Transposase n=1 Tax=Plastoroseomonas arctica TaxID=1509237 RepID=A0AAF1K0D4_9PROT|nr:transposase [Plastoroseomonas arctica]MBR0657496.1 transposase [Plastoroseomonas arctica]
MPPTPLTPTQFHALLPYILPRSPAGRQIGDLRARMDAIFALSCTSAPWRALPPEHGKPDTLSRYFRRLTHAGLWEKLLLAIKDNEPNHPLNQIAPLIFRACRRAIRLRGLRLIALIRRLGFLPALNGPPDKIPNPDLSEKVRAIRLPSSKTFLDHARACLVLTEALRHLHRLAGGVLHLTRKQRLGWS